MATTPNFSWPTPDNTDLVKNGALAIRTLGDAIDASLVDLEGGTTGQVLSKTSNTDMDFTWVDTDDANAIQNAIVDAKGDLIAATANDTPARLAVGTNGQTLVADSTASTGLKWATPDAGGLVLINTTTFTTVASQSLNSVFSSTYDNYKIILTTTALSTDLGLRLRFRAAGSDDTTANYYDIANSFGGSVIAPTGYQATAATSSLVNATGLLLSATPERNSFSIEIKDPFKTVTTKSVGLNVEQTDTVGLGINAKSYLLLTGTSYDGFTLFTSTGTVSGTVSVYGYKK
jgi:hypothetical protein